MDDLKIDPICFTYSHFVNIKDFYEKFEDHLKSTVNLLNIDQDFKESMIELININKFSDLHQILLDLKWFENYIVKKINKLIKLFPIDHRRVNRHPIIPLI